MLNVLDYQANACPLRVKNNPQTDSTRYHQDLRQLRKLGHKPPPHTSSRGQKNTHPRPSASLHACLQGSYSRPEGAPALCDDPRELCQPPGIHLKPLQRVISPSAPCPVIEVIFIKASLQPQKQDFFYQMSMWKQTHSSCIVQHTDNPFAFLVFVTDLFKVTITKC